MKIKYKIIDSLFNLPFFVKKKNICTYQTRVKKVNIKSNFSNIKGLKILFISDLHIDVTPENIENAISQLKNIEYDYCFLGGDYMESSASLENIRFSELFENFLMKLNKDKTFAIMGNHDDKKMIDFIESKGVRVLSNSGINLKYNDAIFLCYGVDYFNPEIKEEERTSREKMFSVFLSHTPDNCEKSFKAGFSLQLSGHTHNGQIQFPKGFAPIKNTKYGKKMLNGLWEHKDIIGITSSGLGCSGIPIRYNTYSEIVLITMI